MVYTPGLLECALPLEISRRRPANRVNELGRPHQLHFEQGKKHIGNILAGRYLRSNSVNSPSP